MLNRLEDKIDAVTGRNTHEDMCVSDMSPSDALDFAQWILKACQEVLTPDDPDDERIRQILGMAVTILHEFEA